MQKDSENQIAYRQIDISFIPGFTKVEKKKNRVSNKVSKKLSSRMIRNKRKLDIPVPIQCDPENLVIWSHVQ